MSDSKTIDRHNSSDSVSKKNKKRKNESINDGTPQKKNDIKKDDKSKPNEWSSIVQEISKQLKISKDHLLAQFPPLRGDEDLPLASCIDHTLLKADATESAIKTLCEEAKQHKFASVCVNTHWVPTCATLLKDSGVKVCTVVGFPLGQMATECKAYEAKWAVSKGAQEVDMVINIGLLKSTRYSEVMEDVREVVRACGPEIVVKCILETCLLSESEIKVASLLCAWAGCRFVKTSTGFSTGGATVEAVKAMKSVIGGVVQIKASGGVKTQQDAETYLKLGVTRIGTSSGIALVSGKTSTSSY
eukprot:NODE_5360_length_1024_cov_64.088790_g4791_i0.p1 GENE.NODE_5360_length_1024_cov_64.088790_g4791_i0~~NODE_5360_length_1024_cov_64.088790_g4791_i0.p1  ORF type:complete len:321 (-),score=77.98 NODE_5360_length_1024_cov_64.088790_g4791_i0:61-966(-)